MSEVEKGRDRCYSEVARKQEIACPKDCLQNRECWLAIMSELCYRETKGSKEVGGGGGVKITCEKQRIKQETRVCSNAPKCDNLHPNFHGKH